MAHPQVTAHARGALLGTVGAADLLDLLGQGLEGGVNLHVTVLHHVGVVSAVVASTEGIGSLLLNRMADEVESTTGSSRWSRGSGESRRTLFGEDREVTNCTYILGAQQLKINFLKISSFVLNSKTNSKNCNSQQGPSLHCDHGVQGVRWVQADRSCHPYQESHWIQKVPAVQGHNPFLTHVILINVNAGNQMDVP